MTDDLQIPDYSCWFPTLTTHLLSKAHRSVSLSYCPCHRPLWPSPISTTLRWTSCSAAVQARNGSRAILSNSERSLSSFSSLDSARSVGAPTFSSDCSTICLAFCSKDLTDVNSCQQAADPHTKGYRNNEETWHHCDKRNETVTVTLGFNQNDWNFQLDWKLERLERLTTWLGCHCEYDHDYGMEMMQSWFWMLAHCHCHEQLNTFNFRNVRLWDCETFMNQPDRLE